VSFLLDQRRELEQKIFKIQGETATRVSGLEAKIADLNNQNNNLKIELTTTTAELTSLKQKHAKCADQRNQLEETKENKPSSSTACTQKRSLLPAIVKDEHAATPVVKKQRLDFVEPETKIALDPFKLIKEIKFQLSRLGLSAKHLAEKLKVTDRRVNEILAHPAPWADLTEVWRDHYRSMHDWLVEHENKERESPIGYRNLVVSEWLNTTEEARKILTLLDMNGIGRAFFAKQKLKLKTRRFEELVTDPLPWESLSDEAKKTFTLIHMWRDAKPAELEELQRYFERFKSFKRERSGSKSSL
jgi:hypothetical protein